MLSIFKKIFGDKSQRDLKEIQPVLTACLQAYETVKTLDNDGLRAKTAEFRKRIQDKVQTEKDAVAALKQQIADGEDTLEVEEKERLYAEIDKIEKEIYEATQAVLNEILPEAFAVGKETARRFADNEEVE
ncbi:MAG: preprotein translocase subunit SecA, partial [Bacteroidales bacterium]|nr:preprotein translocase subunit SecA [Bacteroidales bacterium]